MFVSVVTSSYNRATRLPLLYESLCRQTNQDFEWIIVDDGSTDNTEYVVNTFFRDGKLLIRYFHKENGGMNTAMNLGIKNANGLFIFKVDSDDMLLSNAIDRVWFYYNSKYWKTNSKRELSGICFLNQDINGNIIGDKFKQDIYISDYITVRVNEHVSGDKSEVILTEKRKNALYMEFPGEKRYPTSGGLITLARKYDMLFVNESIYIRDYLEDGITVSRKKGSVIQTPEGSIHYTNLYLKKDIKYSVRVGKAIDYIYYCLQVKRGFFSIVFKSNAPLLVFLMFPRSYFGRLYGRWKEKRETRKSLLERLNSKCLYR